MLKIDVLYIFKDTTTNRIEMRHKNDLQMEGGSFCDNYLHVENRDIHVQLKNTDFYKNTKTRRFMSR